MILLTVPGTVILGCSGMRAVSKFISAIRADLAMRGFAISFFTLSCVVLSRSFILHRFLIARGWRQGQLPSGQTAKARSDYRVQSLHNGHATHPSNCSSSIAIYHRARLCNCARSLKSWIRTRLYRCEQTSPLLSPNITCLWGSKRTLPMSPPASSS
jgi:hypothetical protein